MGSIVRRDDGPYALIRLRADGERGLTRTIPLGQHATRNVLRGLRYYLSKVRLWFIGQ